MHHSRYAAKLIRKHCGQSNRSEDWPIEGDKTPLYYQTQPGRYQVKVHCPHCAKDWYVVWDQDPGPIRRLESVDEPLGSKDVYVKNRFELFSGGKKIPPGTLAVVKKSYPGGMVIVSFPSLGEEGSWTDDVFTQVSREEAGRLAEPQELPKQVERPRRSRAFIAATAFAVAFVGVIVGNLVIDHPRLAGSQVCVEDSAAARTFGADGPGVYRFDRKTGRPVRIPASMAFAMVLKGTFNPSYQRQVTCGVKAVMQTANGMIASGLLIGTIVAVLLGVFAKRRG